MTTLAAIEAAAARMAGHVRRTPILHAPLLDRLAGRRVLVKAECLQVTGSFKARGGWSAVSALPPGAGVATAPRRAGTNRHNTMQARSPGTATVQVEDNPRDCTTRAGQ